ELGGCALTVPRHLGGWVWRCEVGLNDAAIRTSFADVRARVLCRSLILIIMNRGLDAVLRQFQCDSSSEPARTPRDQCVLSIECHITLPGLLMTKKLQSRN